jgi:hypothetical protein
LSRWQHLSDLTHFSFQQQADYPCSESGMQTVG